jgi:hypothetical protein
VIKGR